MIMDPNQLEDADRRGFNPYARGEHGEPLGYVGGTPSMNPTEQAAQSAADSQPAEPEPGTVVGFTKRFREDGPGYAYVAIRIKGRGWFTTGSDVIDPQTWGQILEFADGAQLWVTRDWTRLTSTTYDDGVR